MEAERTGTRARLRMRTVEEMAANVAEADTGQMPASDSLVGQTADG
jgi:hypothetical protein